MRTTEEKLQNKQSIDKKESWHVKLKKERKRSFLSSKNNTK